MAYKDDVWLVPGLLTGELDDLPSHGATKILLKLCIATIS